MPSAKKTFAFASLCPKEATGQMPQTIAELKGGSRGHPPPPPPKS
ncbi:hypothetical protein CCACVL1_25584 [Corchorus capsularis]|uniref:Uncharacterized protein n=1 Tax=Corchorus capsularis TaxID=210143 RepID=A0A1R3GJ43_COCAP|nr:hypothetical protein CCACVL1_25584 [Corchorus capsularis]